VRELRVFAICGAENMELWHKMTAIAPDHDSLARKGAQSGGTDLTVGRVRSTPRAVVYELNLSSDLPVQLR
jgi:hypothetical protein